MLELLKQAFFCFVIPLFTVALVIISTITGWNLVNQSVTSISGKQISESATEKVAGDLQEKIVTQLSRLRAEELLTEEV